MKRRLDGFQPCHLLPSAFPLGTSTSRLEHQLHLANKDLLYAVNPLHKIKSAAGVCWVLLQQGLRSPESLQECEGSICWCFSVTAPLVLMKTMRMWCTRMFCLTNEASHWCLERLSLWTWPLMPRSRCLQQSSQHTMRASQDRQKEAQGVQHHLWGCCEDLLIWRLMRSIQSGPVI